jgi:hypothetical protein
MTHPNDSTPINTHSVTYRGETRECNQDNMQDVCDALIEKLGPLDYANNLIPVVVPLNRPIPRPAIPPAAPTLRLVPNSNSNVSEEGKARSLDVESIALDAGFAPRPPLYEAGTRVNETGVANARREQLEHDAKPFARDVARDLVTTIKQELRRDTDAVTVSDLRMSKTAALALPGGVRLPMSPRAFAGLISRLPVTGGTAYLAQCPEELRAINVNHWAVELGKREAADTATDPKQAVIRTRQVQGKRSAFAVVSPSYTPFDTDKIAEALHMALPTDARGEVQYDGQRMRLEALWRSDVAPDEFVAGEFFKAGVIVRADDTGAGSIRVQSVLWRNLCLNLIILDKAVGVDIRIRHTGSVQALAERFRESFGQALSSVQGFRRAWGYAMSERDETLIQRSQGTTSDDIIGLPVSAVLPGLLHGILDRELVPVRGRKADVIPALLEMHRQDEAADAYGVSRASIANAFTRYAHRVETDPFESDLIREGAGRLLSGSRGKMPAPLPYKAFVA